MEKVCVVIVTYNRKKYLIKLLEALKSQIKKPEKVLIFDNKSTDGTDEYLKEFGIIDELGNAINRKDIDGITFIYYKNDENGGGAGGFHGGIKLALEEDCEYIWMMDDDVLPEQNCLELLLKQLNDDVRVCVPCRTDSQYTDYAIIDLDMTNPFKYSIKKRKKMINSSDIEGEIIYVKDMPFEGPIFATSLIKQIGVPNKDLFIIFDDTEYAYRASSKTNIAYVKNAILHKQIVPTTNSNLGWKEYYSFRNLFWFDKTYGKNVFVKYMRPVLNYCELLLRSLIKRRMCDMKVVNRAWADAWNNSMGKTVIPGQKF